MEYWPTTQVTIYHHISIFHLDYSSLVQIYIVLLLVLFYWEWAWESTETGFTNLSSQENSIAARECST